MKRSQSSITAEGIALIRAIESSKPERERICYDPYARYFVNPRLAFFGKVLAGYGARRSPGVIEFLTARTRYIDDYLRSCVAD
ncbi:MAG: class I SAM-dependent methyltransferase [Chloroflexi bacterium]|nr:class I SAM-dependent methyltransferase [Chloroflexota bacterium]